MEASSLVTCLELRREIVGMDFGEPDSVVSGGEALLVSGRGLRVESHRRLADAETWAASHRGTRGQSRDGVPQTSPLRASG